MSKTAIIICSYNMFEWTDALVEHIIETVKVPYELVVVDNGSDLVEPSRYTTFYISENIQMIPGFLAGLDYLDGRNGKYTHYWLITTSCKFNSDDKRDPLAEMLPIFESDSNTFAVQPSLTFNYGAWEQWLSPRKPYVPRRIWGLEQVCPLFDAKKFDQIGRWRKELTRGWGVGGETFWKARRNGWHVYTHDGYVMHKETEIGYHMDRMMEDVTIRRSAAAQEAKDILIPIYGENFNEKFRYEYTELGSGGLY